MAQPAPEVPGDILVEQALIGALLIDNKLIDQAAIELNGDHFFEALHGRIFEMQILLQSEGAVTPLILNSVMKTDPALKEVGGIAYLAALAAAAPSLPRVRDLTRVIKDCAIRRQIIAVAQGTEDAARAPAPGVAATSIAEEATDALLRIAEQRAKVSLTPYQVALESLRAAERIAKGGIVPLVKTGLEKVDDLIGGMEGSDLWIVAAKSGMGKSALLCSTALWNAVHGVPVFFWTGEMTAKQIVNRMVCDLMHDYCLSEGIPPLWYFKIRNGRLSTREFDLFGEFMAKLDGLPMEICDENLTMAQIRARARAFRAKHKDQLGLIVGDYIQIIDPGEVQRGTSREQIVNGLARGCKALAKETNWPVMFGSQMNEDANARGKDEKRPQPQDVRESKGIFNEADGMLSPWRPAYFIENRRPESGAGPMAQQNFESEMLGAEHVLEILGLKTRHGRRFSTECWTEIGSNAIRDHKPFATTTADHQGLLV